MRAAELEPRERGGESRRPLEAADARRRTLELRSGDGRAQRGQALTSGASVSAQPRQKTSSGMSRTSSHAAQRAG